MHRDDPADMSIDERLDEVASPLTPGRKSPAAWHFERTPALTVPLRAALGTHSLTKVAFFSDALVLISQKKPGFAERQMGVSLALATAYGRFGN